jgi:uncharacterized protein (TIGR03435 family)
MFTDLSTLLLLSITWAPGPRNRQQPAAPADGMASEPTGEISFFEAMEKQLGLRLTKQKLPYPALVIDSVGAPQGAINVPHLLATVALSGGRRTRYRRLTFHVTA